MSISGTAQSDRNYSHMSERWSVIIEHIVDPAAARYARRKPRLAGPLFIALLPALYFSSLHAETANL
jgi:hypothetical protein